jgi:protein MpaA
MEAEAFLLSHRAHDVAGLLARWKRLARTLRLRPERLCRAGEFDVLALQSRGQTPGLYISAGIHGDEPGATEGLFRWAARGGLEDLRARGIPFFLAPCLNPWGLANNRRHNAEGIDLNRRFRSRTISPIPELRAHLRGECFRLALTLHEDYDAQGLYLYEVRGPKPYWGERLSSAVAKILPPDSRPSIEGRRARRGVIRPRLTDALTRRFLRRGCPEALWLLYDGHAERVFTFETPSEFSLERRAETHSALVTEAVRLAFPRSDAVGPRSLSNPRN